MWERAAGLALGFAADRLLGDPARLHPVAGFGQVAACLERRMYADSRPRGVLYAGALVATAVGTGLLAERCTRRRPIARTIVVAASTWAVLGGRSLRREAGEVARLLDLADLPAARDQVTHLVGRDPRDLSAPQIARATVESLAENVSDAVVAPLLAGAVLGVPGLLGYRAANTLDAMVGHRSERYERFGWASARFDDLLNLAPARLSAVLCAAFAPVVGGPSRAALRAWHADAAAHPSPNAGVVEAAFAGALGITLGGTNSYGGRVEQRPMLGTGPAPTTEDIDRAIRLADAVAWSAAACSVAVAVSRVGTPIGQRRRLR